MFPKMAISRRASIRTRSGFGGFTLIELLVVIMIILILMAALMPVYSKIMLRARREATSSLIGALSASLERYKVDFDCYPPNPDGATEDDGTLFDTLNGPENRGFTANPGTARERHYEPYFLVDRTNVKKINGRQVIVDSWGQAIHYFNCKSYVEEKNGNPKFCHNPTAFDIYSTGQDRQRDPDLIEPGTAEVKDRSETKFVDDIANFGS